ncbi:hypothetical protein HELRODRAFT_166662 [Helobdella robusta]|uniref:BIG2 domain-containing protein n=1 Tax=Helobdella robusta TaxID=6412 RepID=T1EYB9_HELRO|nr:hypothetical protein HELRODRAFT_166662 [Helobdella robusta]ESO11648.1 hypothetical protein HELRODRAFT_166662 [Helobdella robusta]
MNLKILFSIFFLLTGVAVISDSQKLNVPKLLLPYNSLIGINFTLEATEGCLSWKSTRPDIATVQLIYDSDHHDNRNENNDCSRVAVVASVTKIPDRKTAIIIAQDIASGKELRCDVIVDKIVSIKIQTTTKELYLDDSPEEFVLKAYNDKDDVFSSLEGMEFDWNLMPDNATSQVEQPAPNKVLRILKYSESSYVAPSYIRSLEQDGRRGDVILIKGLHTGSAMVTVRAVDEHIEIEPVRTLVVANLQLVPSVVYIMPHTSVQFTVELLKQGKAFKVTMPSSIYYLHTNDDDVIFLDVTTSTITGLTVGHTDVRLKGQNAQLAGVFREPSAGVYVVEPSYIEFSISPACNWVLETDKEYAMHKVRIELNLPQEFQLLDSSVNGSYHYVKAKQKGVFSLYAKLAAIVKDGGVAIRYESVDGSHDLEVINSIVVNVKQARGGKGKYVWKADDNLMIQIVATASGGNVGISEATAAESGSALVQIQSDRVRMSYVRAIDAKHPTFKDDCLISVLPPKRIEINESHVEVVLNEEVTIPFALILSDGTNDFPAYACEHLDFIISASNDNIFDHIEVHQLKSFSSSSKPSLLSTSPCAALRMKAKNLGTTELFVTYTYNDVVIGSSFVLAVYQPLMLVSPDNFVTISPGTSSKVVVVGGPMPWLLDDTKYFRKVTTRAVGGADGEEDDDEQSGSSISFSDIESISHSSGQMHTFTVFCHEEDEKFIRLSVGNGPTAHNRRPAVSQLYVPVSCSEPKFLKISSQPYVEEMLEGCDLKAFKRAAIPVPAGQEVHLKVNLYNRHSNKIENTTSVAIKWSLSDASLASFDIESAEDRGALSYGDNVLLHTNGYNGDLAVSVTVEMYNHLYGNRKMDPILSDQINFHLLKYPTLSSSSPVLLNSPYIKGRVIISHGSGQFDVSNNSATAALVTCNDDGDNRDGASKDSSGAASLREILITPLREGRCEIIVTDRCLLPIKHIMLNLPLEDKDIKNDVTDKTVDVTYKLIIRVTDKDNITIPSEYFHLMAFQVFSTDERVLSVGNQLKLLDEHSAYLTVRTRSVGKTSIHIEATINGNLADNIKTGSSSRSSSDKGSGSGKSAGSGDVYSYDVISNAVAVQQVILMKSFDTLQVTTSGGPQTDCLINYHLQPISEVSETNRKQSKQRKDGEHPVAVVDKQGLVTAVSVGEVKVVAECSRSWDAGAGDQLIYSQASMSLSVVQMAGVKIFSPVQKVQVPLYAVGSHNRTIDPYSFSEECKFHWTISDHHVAQLRPAFHKTNFSTKSSGNFAQRLMALRSGHVTVTLRVNKEDGTQMIDSITVKIVDRFQMLSPSIQPAHVLLTPNTQLKLLSNFKLSSSYKPKDGTVHFSESEGVLESTSAIGSFPVIFEAHHTNLGGGVDSSKISMASHDDDGDEDRYHANKMQTFVAKVKPISYIMITPVTHLHIYGNQSLSSFPIGLEFDLIVTFHDEIGFKFDAVNVDWAIAMNKHSSLKILEDQQHHHQLMMKNGTLKMMAMNSGFSVVKGQPASWSVPDDLLFINSQSGVAVAYQLGNSEVIFNFNSFVTSTKVKITPVLRYLIRLDGADSDLLSDAMSVKLVRVLLVGEKNDESCMEKVKVEQLNVTNFLYQCHAEFSTIHPHDDADVKLGDILNVEPFFSYTTVHLTINPPILSTVLTASPGSHLQPQPEGAVLKFVPAFHVLDADMYKVSYGIPDAYLRVLARKDVVDCIKVKSENDIVLQADKHPSSMDGDVVSFRVTLPRPLPSYITDNLPKWVKVVLRCEDIGQEVGVNVKISLDGDEERDEDDLAAAPSSLSPFSIWRRLRVGLRAYYEWVFYIFLCLFSFFCLFSTYMFFNPPPPSSASASLSSPSSPFVSSPGAYYSRSPTTTSPQIPQSSPKMAPNIYNTPSYQGGSPRGQRLWTLNSSPLIGKLS